MIFKVGDMIGNKKLTKLVHKKGLFERWEYECTICGCKSFITRNSLRRKEKTGRRCPDCAKEFQSISKLMGK